MKTQAASPENPPAAAVVNSVAAAMTKEGPGFRTVAIDKLQESTTNPRRSFDERKLKELAENFKVHGVLVPLLVRPVKAGVGPVFGHLEIIAGARRYRAAKLAGLIEAPVRVVELSDSEVLEVQLIENLQREDVHPLEEGEGFQRLLDIEGYTPELIAEKVGRDRSYIYKRLQLAKLIEPLKGKFLDGEIQIAHALLLCRLSEPAQIEAAKQGLYESKWTGGRHERFVVNAQELAGWIRQNVYLDLKHAPWNKLDADLVPKAGACNVCPKRSGTSPQLFDDLPNGSDVCLDGDCFRDKREARLVQIEKESAAKGDKLIRVATEYLDAGSEKKLRCIGTNGYSRLEGKKKRCGSSERALVVTGRTDVGNIINICRDRSCKTHHPYGSSARRQDSFGEVWAEKRRRLTQNIKWKTRIAVLKAVLAKQLKWEVPHAQLQLVASSLLPYSTPSEVLDALDVPAAKGKKLDNGSAISKFLQGMIDAPKGSPAAGYLPRIVLALSLQASVKEYCHEGNADFKRLKDAAETFRIDWKAVEKKCSVDLIAAFEKSKAKAAANQKKKLAAVAAAPKVKAAAPDVDDEDDLDGE